MLSAADNPLPQVYTGPGSCNLRVAYHAKVNFVHRRQLLR